MSSARELHDRAMTFVDQAIRERDLGNTEQSRDLFRKALESEMAAIEELPEQGGLAWSILHRSAGAMALDCKDFQLAQQLASRALTDDPHPEIEDELRELWSKADNYIHNEVTTVDESAFVADE